MEYFLAGSSALKLIRLIRKNGCDLTLAPTDTKYVSRLPKQYLALQSLEIPELCNLLEVSETRKLHLLVPDRSSRRRTNKIKTSLRSCPRGPHPYLEVLPKNLETGSALIPAGTRIFVECPASVVLSMAYKLARKERGGQLSHQKSALMLLKLCLELCGTYTLDPLNPNGGNATFFLDPVLSISELAACSKSVHRLTGLSLVNEIIPFIFERAASPGESFSGCALFCPSEYGGLCLGDFESNKAFDLNAQQRKALNMDQLTPDLYMAAYRIAIEYNGELHEQGDNPKRDNNRMNGYAMLSCRGFVITRFEVSGPREFNKFASKVVGAIENYEGAAARHRFDRLVNDADFLARQSVLFDVYKAQLEI